MWTCVAVLIATAIITIGGLVGRITLGGGDGKKHDFYMKALFSALILEVVGAGVSAFYQNLQQKQIEDDKKQDATIHTDSNKQPEKQPTKKQNPRAPDKSDAAVLNRAIFFTRTNDDDKDHNTGVWVTVTSSNGQLNLAKADNRDNSSSEATRYPDHTDHSFELDVLGHPTKEQCRGFRTTVRQTTVGNDTWKFNCRVVLYFSDGTEDPRSRDSVVLINNDASVSF